MTEDRRSGAPTLAVPPDALHRVGRGAATVVGLGGAWALGRGVVPVAPPCPLRWATGIPCPFCGITRLADVVADGAIGHALDVDPGGVVALAVLVALPLAALAITRSSVRTRTWTARLLVGSLAAAIAVHWATVLVHGADVVVRT